METTPGAIDPLLGVLAPRALTSPLAAATAYSILATGTSLVAATLENRLVGNTQVHWGQYHLTVHPFLSNVSTILDFAVLNPLVIFFLLRSRQIVTAEPLLAAGSTVWDKALQWFAAVSCSVLAIVLMIAYSESFLLGKFFDAIVTVSDRGEAFVTVTGWVVFFWTGLFTYVVLMGALNQVSYVVRICRLAPNDLSYDPLHEDEAAGMRIFAKPAIEFTKASFLLVVMAIVFWIYDRLMTGAPLTDRTASMGVFTMIVIPLFAVPIGRLHLLMCSLREGLLRSILGGEPHELRDTKGTLSVVRRDPMAFKQLVDEVEAAEKLRDTVLSFPTWPISMRTLVSCGAYFASIAAPVATKLLPLISASLGVAT